MGFAYAVAKASDKKTRQAGTAARSVTRCMGCLPPSNLSNPPAPAEGVRARTAPRGTAVPGNTHDAQRNDERSADCLLRQREARGGRGAEDTPWRVERVQRESGLLRSAWNGAQPDKQARSWTRRVMRV